MLKYLFISLMALQYLYGRYVPKIKEISENVTPPNPPNDDCNCVVNESMMDEVQELVSLMEEEQVKGQSSIFEVQNILDGFQVTLEEFPSKHEIIIQQEVEILKESLAKFQQSRVELTKNIKTKVQHLLHENRNMNITAHQANLIQTLNGTIEKFWKSCIINSGIYKIQIPNYDEPFDVSCDNAKLDSNWMIIQRRESGFINFDRNWTEYKQGFGSFSGEFWIGLEKLYALTSNEPYELKIIMEDFENRRVYASYDDFAIGNETEYYYLKTLGNYLGSAGNSLELHKQMKFATFDNDTNGNNCAQQNTGGWWFHDCLHSSNLNGQYLKGQILELGKGVVWDSFHLKYSLKYVQMMIRCKHRCNYELC